MIFALIPAAGHSTRMGRPKLALPVGTRSVLEWTVGTLRQAGVAHVLVVLAPHVADLGILAEGAGARVLHLSKSTPDMRTTVERGLRFLEEAHQPRPDDAWLLVPADHPALDVNSIQILVETFHRSPAHSIAIPTFGGKRGHPAIIGWQHVAAIRALPPELGLNAYLRQHSADVLEVPVDSDTVLLDLDTPADYELLLQRFAKKSE